MTEAGGKLWALLAPEGFSGETERELRHLGLSPLRREGGFFLFEGDPVEVAWSAVTWLRVLRLPAPSIAQAARDLRPLARRWELLPTLHRRRSALVHEQLRPFRRAPLAFPGPRELPEGTGAFTMLDEGEALWCRSFDRPDPLGLLDFAVDRDNPPSRAYLKLWEALTLLRDWPRGGQRALDLGGSPGGWTWVLARLGAEVLTVDRAPLDPRVQALPSVTFRQGDAFRALPEAEGPVDWLCSDVICAPERLLGLVRAWVESGRARHCVCTLKFQGEASPAVVEEFRRLGRVLHLHHNKHELTFLR